MEGMGEMGIEETKMEIGVEVMIRMVEIKEIKMETKMAMETGMIMEMTTMGEEEITMTTMGTRMETITTIKTEMAKTKIRTKVKTKTKTKARTTETEIAMAMTTTTTTMETDVNPEKQPEDLLQGVKSASDCSCSLRWDGSCKMHSASLSFERVSDGIELFLWPSVLFEIPFEQLYYSIVICSSQESSASDMGRAAQGADFGPFAGITAGSALYQVCNVNMPLQMKHSFQGSLTFPGSQRRPSVACAIIISTPENAMPRPLFFAQ